MEETYSNPVKDTIAADILGLAVQTLRNMRCRGEGPPYIKLGRAIRYWPEDLIGYLQERKIQPGRLSSRKKS